jgi:carnitine 3-dehydrogenase
MAKNRDFHNAAIAGIGVISASWAARFLSGGFNVIATDPGPKAKANLRKYVEEAWRALENEGAAGLLSDPGRVGR